MYFFFFLLGKRTHQILNVKDAKSEADDSVSHPRLWQNHFPTTDLEGFL